MGLNSKCRGTSWITNTRSLLAETKCAEVSKKWFRVRDTYGVQVEPGQDVIVLLAATVALDMMTS